VEIVPFAGWANNARIVCGDVEMLVTLDVGPRVISYGRVGGPNLFVVHEEDAGQTGGEHFRSYGGHRVWIAPEEHLRSWRPDNVPVDYEVDGGWHIFTSKPDVYHTQKQLRILPDRENERFVLLHRVYNHSPYDLELAAWAATQCRTGEILFPQAAYVSHSEQFQPARPLVLWPYTKMRDARWTWGDHVIRLLHNDNPEPQKVGARISQGYAGLVSDGELFLKRFPFESDAYYPDFDSNFEAFTRNDMLEVETLGPLVSVPPGGYAEHQETWYLVPAPEVPAGDAEAGDWLARIAAERPL
jgi:hypothetical protein